MATNQTSNYQLNQWEPTDKVLRTEFNADNQKIDAALGALAQTVASTAANAGNCEMEIITYTGTGTYGASSPTKINFTHRPDVFFAAGDLTLMVGLGGTDEPILVCRSTNNSSSFVSTGNASWNGTQLSFTGTEPRYQMNTKNIAYWVLGLRKKG